MDEVLKGSVFQDDAGSVDLHLRRERCGDIKKIEIHGNVGYEFLNSSHFLLTNDGEISDQFKKCFNRDSSGELADDSSCRLHQNPQKHTNNDNSVKRHHNGGRNPLENTSYPVKEVKRNGFLKEESIPLYGHSRSSRKINQNIRSSLSGKSCNSSDEFLEVECQSMPHISMSFHDKKITLDGPNESNSSISGVHHVVSKSSSELEKDHAKKKISFRALVRMKGLGKKLRRKNTAKSKHRQLLDRTEHQATDPLLDSSAKCLLEYSTSVTDDQPQSNHATLEERPQNDVKSSHSINTFTPTSTRENVGQNDIHLSLGEIVCSSEYLRNRRGAICEEIEKTILSGEQSLAELRSILVIQHKLTGFGLL